MTENSSATPHDRKALRARLLAERAAWALTPAGHAANAALSQQLRQVLTQLEPQCLGLYWPLEGEFNAAAALQGLLLPDEGHGAAPADEGEDEDDDDDEEMASGFFAHPLRLALPFAYKSAARRMEYRRWDGHAPEGQDECGIPSSLAATVQPDMVLVPCVGYTREGYRLGYGGGYFDRWLAAHPGVTSIGLAWSLSETQFSVEAHDQALTLILTEKETLML